MVTHERNSRGTGGPTLPESPPDYLSVLKLEVGPIVPVGVEVQLSLLYTPRHYSTRVGNSVSGPPPVLEGGEGFHWSLRRWGPIVTPAYFFDLKVGVNRNDLFRMVVPEFTSCDDFVF